jgi:tRNA pseudouridine38-40 synthase
MAQLIISLRMRYFLELAYDGTRFHGWQTQPNAVSVQQVLDKGLSTLLREPIGTTGSGRTDTGVHATQQFAHFDVSAPVDAQEICYRLNRLLPPDITVLGVYAVGSAAHARFDAIARTYEYRVSLVKDPFLRAHSYLAWRKPDVKQMNRAAALLLGFEDFTTFSKTKGATPHYRCQLYEAGWSQKGDLLVFTIRANRFLRGMVRLVVGTLLEVGAGKRSVEEFMAAVAAQDRRRAGGAAAAAGLFLTRVEYPPGYFEEQERLFGEQQMESQ